MDINSSFDDIYFVGRVKPFNKQSGDRWNEIDEIYQIELSTF